MFPIKTTAEWCGDTSENIIFGIAPDGSKVCGFLIKNWRKSIISMGIEEKLSKSADQHI